MYLTALQISCLLSSDKQENCTGPLLPRNACQIIKYSCKLHEAHGLRTLFVYTTWHIINGHSEERSKTQQYFARRKILTVWIWAILLCKRQNNTRKQRGEILNGRGVSQLWSSEGMGGNAFWNFRRQGGVKTWKPSVVGYGYFLELPIGPYSFLYGWSALPRPQAYFQEVTITVYSYESLIHVCNCKLKYLWPVIITCWKSMDTENYNTIIFFKTSKICK